VLLLCHICLSTGPRHEGPFPRHGLGVFASNTNTDLPDELKTAEARRERYPLEVSVFNQKKEHMLFLWAYAVKYLVENVISLEK
jgi:hypothetical protein